MITQVCIPLSVPFAYPSPSQNAAHSTQKTIQARLNIASEYIPTNQGKAVG